MRSLKNYEKGSVSLLTCSQILPLVVELPVIVNVCLLVLLVLGDQVVQVGLRLDELHFVHALTSVPVEESLRIQKMNVALRNGQITLNLTFRRNMAVNCSEILLKSSWMAVELPMNVDAILRPHGGMSHTAVLMLFGIHSTK